VAAVLATVAEVAAAAAASVTVSPTGMVLLQADLVDLAVRLEGAADMDRRRGAGLLEAASRAEVGIAGTSSAKHLVGMMTGIRNGPGIKVSVCSPSSIWWVQVYVPFCFVVVMLCKYGWIWSLFFRASLGLVGAW
jgi:hypothetical protein